MSTLFAEALVILFLIACNGVLAMSEIAIISARKTRLQQLARQGSQRAKVAMDLAGAPTSFLASVQIGITLIGILAGAFGGATIAEELASIIKASVQPGGMVATYAEPMSFGVVVVTIAFFSLVLGELVPKRFGLNYPESIALAVGMPLKFFARLTNPVVRALSFSTDRILALLGANPHAREEITEEEVKLMIEQGAAAGVFQKEEETIMKRALRLGDRRVDELMTPRLKIVMLDLADSFEDNMRKMMASPHSYFPVYEANPDQVTGLVSVKQLWQVLASGNRPDLRRMLIDPLFVMETTPSLKVLEMFKSSGKHLAIVIDEYGGTAGIITLIDILEAIVGDIPDDEAKSEKSAVKRKDGTWLVEGMMGTQDMKELFHIAALPHEKHGGYQTLGGMIMMCIGRIPRETDVVLWQGWRFEVIDMDGHRVDKVLVTPPEKSK
jgi:putative hemolysin